MHPRFAVTAFALALSLAAGSAAAAAPIARQWLYVADAPNGPTAIFLDWTYSSVVLRIHCDRATGELVFIAPDVTQSAPPWTMDLSLGEGRPITMKVKPLDADSGGKVTSTAQHALVGRLKVSRRLLAAMARAVDIEIGAPNDMDEAWHVGRAEPFRRVARSCPVR